MKYRPEIDGLRAIAVIIVILFHAGFKSFSGGFVGVDVFFVISGYLITTIIVIEKERGDFSFICFYERRIRRIFPPLFLVLFVSLVSAWFWLLPSEMKDFSQSLTAVSYFSSNIFFRRTSGYWDISNELKPLIHTWSLSVEEQFYLFFPLFITLLGKYHKKWLWFSITTIFTVSLLYAHWGAYNNPTPTFYLLPARIWELLIGAGIALYFLHQKNTLQSIFSNNLLNELLSLCGLFMIAFAVYAFDEETPFPSFYALIPTIGTGLIISFSATQTIVGRMLSSKPLVSIGLISYSAYLWHQPLFAFARYLSIIKLSEGIFILLILLTLLIAYISWRYIENPFRSKNRFSKKFIFTFALTGSLAFAIVGLIGKQNNGFTDRFTNEQKNILAFAQYDRKDMFREGICFLTVEQKSKDFKRVCSYLGSDENSFFIWGDSHAAALSYGLREISPAVTQITASGCPPLIGYTSTRRPYCEEINEFALKRIKKLKPKYLLLHANWSEPLDKIEPSLEEVLSTTLLRIKENSPETEIIIIGGVPKWKPTLPNILVRFKIQLADEAFIYSNSYDEIQDTDNTLNIFAKENEVKFISLLD
ncbi:MAG: hypothetical protein RL536_388, partial [Candidatus Parcubacteria bacterium]